MELFDFQGRMLERINVDSGIYKLDMSSYSRGIYMIQLIGPDRNFVQKIIKE